MLMSLLSLFTDDREVNEIVPADDEELEVRQPLTRSDFEVLSAYFTAWQQRYAFISS